MVMREVKFPHDKQKGIHMERDLRLMLVQILETLTEILELQKSNQKNESSYKEKQLLND